VVFWRAPPRPPRRGGGGGLRLWSLVCLSLLQQYSYSTCVLVA
jgi:hypothetical protein